MSNRLILEGPKIVIVLLVVLFADDTLQNVTRRNATTYDVSYQNVGYNNQISDPSASSTQPIIFMWQNFNICNSGKFQCHNKQCIELSKLCDGRKDCRDNSDESLFYCNISRCNDNQFKCANGDCIDLFLKCDGTINCLDGLDEDKDLCKYVKGYPHQYQHPFTRFKTTTSTEATALKCVAPADVEGGKITQIKIKRGYKIYNSIELTCDSNSFDLIGSGHSTCLAGVWSPALGVCKRKCCALQRVGVNVTCQHLNVNINCTKQIPSGSTAQATCQMGYKDIGSVHLKCIDGNWNYGLPECTIDKTRRNATTDDGSIPSVNLKCAVPTDVEEGKIALLQIKRGNHSIELTCDSNSFDLEGSSHSTCFNDGKWRPALGVCKRKCDALQGVGVSVTCKHLNANIKCNQKIPSGSTARATCKMGYKEINPVNLKCIDGNWDNDLPKCTIDCGITSESSIIDEKKATTNGFPWHVVIYELLNEGYKQICGGTLLTEKIVISAAHCFWLTPKTSLEKPGLKDPLLYSVAAGKTYRSYNHTENTAQITTIEKILIPESYSGNTYMQMSDIALLILTDPLKFTREVLPICYNMQSDFVNYQLRDGGIGTMARWGVTSVGDNPSEEILYANLPFISKNNCIKDMPDSFRRYITYDKFCAGYVNRNISTCSGDVGSGLVFASGEAHIIRYYIQGVVSVGALHELGTTCSTGYYTTFTKIEKYKHWINEQLVEYKS